MDDVAGLPGVGLLYSTRLEPLFQAARDLITFVELEPQTLWRYVPWESAPYRRDDVALARIRRLPQTKLVHSVGFPVGGSRPPDHRAIDVVVETIEDLRAPWASEHLAFNTADGTAGEFRTAFLLPPLQTPNGVDAAVKSIRAVSSKMSVPFLVETGVNYLQPRRGEIADGAFVASVAEGADCGILLDLHNLWTNERNGRQSVAAFLAEIPLHRVVEIHLAGGLERQGYWLDAHSGAVPDEVIELARSLIPELPSLQAVIFEILPAFVDSFGVSGVRAEIERIRDACVKGRRRSAWPGRKHVPRVSLSAANVATTSSGDWENTLGALVIGRESNEPLATELQADPGLRVYQSLVWDFRAGMLAETLPSTFRLLLVYGAEGLVREVLDAFVAERTPELFASAEAEAFAAFLARTQPQIPYLLDVLAFESAAITVYLKNVALVAHLRHEPTAVFAALKRGLMPVDIPEGRYEVEITPSDQSLPIGGVISST